MDFQAIADIHQSFISRVKVRTVLCTTISGVHITAEAPASGSLPGPGRTPVHQQTTVRLGSQSFNMVYAHLCW